MLTGWRYSEIGGRSCDVSRASVQSISCAVFRSRAASRSDSGRGAGAHAARCRPARHGRRRLTALTAPAAQHVDKTRPEPVGQERVQQRVDGAVEVVDDERERRNDQLPVVDDVRLGERLPEHADVVRQDADGERRHDSDEQSDDFASPADQLGVVGESRLLAATACQQVPAAASRLLCRHRLHLVQRSRCFHVARAAGSSGGSLLQLDVRGAIAAVADAADDA